jgi:hypothetical protein
MRGGDSFNDQESSELYIKAIEDSPLPSINYNYLQNIYEEAPILDRCFKILTTNAFISQDKHTISAQEKNTPEHHLEFCSSYPDVEHRVPKRDMVNYLGVTPENLSIIRSKLNPS